MKNRKNLLFADDQGEFCERCKEELAEKGFDTKMCPKNGQRLLVTIKEQTPDVVIMDAFLSGTDAIGVLSAIPSLELSAPPVFFTTAAAEHPAVASQLLRAGAAYHFVKPFDPAILAERVESIVNYEQASSAEHREPAPRSSIDLETTVTDIILEIGVPAHIKGYQYVRDAIIMTVEHRDYINGVTKILYPSVAKMNGTTPSRVERAIRHAIEVAWDRGDVDILNGYFGYTVHNLRGKPTNSEFIAMIADKIRLRQKASDNRADNH